MKSLCLTPVLFVLTFFMTVEFDGMALAVSAMQDSQSTSDNDAGDLELGPMQKIGPPVMQILNLKFDLDRKFIFVDQKSWGRIRYSGSPRSKWSATANHSGSDFEIVRERA